LGQCPSQGIWQFEFIWDLEFGAWNLILHMSRVTKIDFFSLFWTLGIWSLEFVWNLVLEIWNLSPNIAFF
jgi:hypothetical protein